MKQRILLGAAMATVAAAADLGGTLADGGNTQVSAMMMFVGNEKKVYILDKSEYNSATVNGHPAWGAVWDIDTHKATTMDIRTNTFCASGMHLPNGSFATFGGNSAAGPLPNAVASNHDQWYNGIFDDTYQDYDGRNAIRVMDPCLDESCAWYDNPQALAMQRNRWYSAAEPMADGTVAIIGGYVNGGYINRNYPNKDPARSGGASEPSTEFFPSNGQEPRDMQFMIDTSGLNSYAHTFLMPSGKMLLQANLSTMLWDPETNAETRLPDMPNGVVRVYPGSGAVAMLPLTPKNSYNPTLLFCGGQSNMPEDVWGNFSWPFVDTWTLDSSKDCQRLTPEPLDNSPVAYEQDDDMFDGRTMGQFIILPTGKLLIVNGGAKGTAGYSTQTLTTQSYSDMPFGMSLAAEPVLKPAMYDPDAPKGSRWSNDGFDTSKIPRLYHSSALLLPDGSVLIAGSNPNLDVNLTTVFPTTYQAEIFYPPYFNAKVRPAPTGVPKTLSYGGASFDITVPADSYSGVSNDAADSTEVVVIRPGWTTHGMNMGQRFLQLNSTYTVKDDGTLVLHVSQMPPTPEIFQPGPAFIYVVVNGVPSKGTYCIVGSGNIEKQPTSAAAALPDNVRVDSAHGAASTDSTTSGTNGGGSDSGSSNGDSDSSGIKTSTIGIIVGAVAVVAILGALLGVFIARRRRAANNRRVAPGMSYGATPGHKEEAGYGHARDTNGSGFAPLQQDDRSQVWSPAPPQGYKDYDPRQSDASTAYDPYVSYGHGGALPKEGYPPSPNPGYRQ